MFGGLFIAMLAAAIIYAKGYEGGSGVRKGCGSALLLGVFDRWRLPA